MIYSAAPNLVKTAHLMLRYVHPSHCYIRIFEVATTHELSGRRAESTTYNRGKRNFYWPGMFK